MPLDFKFPDVGEGTTEGTLIKWLVKEGDTVKSDQPIAEIETDKAVVEIPSPRNGTILKLYGKSGEVLKVGAVLATIGEKGEIANPATPPSSSATPPSTSFQSPVTSSASSAGSSSSVLATPSTRQLARQLGIDIATVKGTGANGRITDEDVRNATALQNAMGKSPSTNSNRAPTPNVSSPSVPPAGATASLSPAWKSEGPEERFALKGIRKTISEHMVKSMFTAVQVTHMDDVDVTALVKLREKKKEEMKKKGIPLTYLPFIAKACAAALKNHPWMNASIDDSTNEIVYKKYYNIGIAVDTEDGLMVVNVRDADKKSIVQLSQEMAALAQQARERKVAVENLKGSTFTITNIGSLGGTYATPVINWPEVAILGVGKIQEKAVVKDGKIIPRHIMTVSLTFDHRLIDGAQAVRFCNEVLQHLEDPGLFLVDVV